MPKYKVTYTDPFQDELNIIVTAYGSNEAVYIAEKAVDMYEVLSVEECHE
jgi:hypothetical protein